MAVTMTNRGKFLFASGGITTSTDVRMGLLKTLTGHTNVPDINTVAEMEAHADFAELTGAAGYARVALTGITITEDDAGDRALYDANDVSFGALGTGGTIVGYFLYKFNASDSSAEVLCIGDLTSTPTNGGTFTVTTGSGLIQLT